MTYVYIRVLKRRTKKKKKNFRLDKVLVDVQIRFFLIIFFSEYKSEREKIKILVVSVSSWLLTDHKTTDDYCC